MRRIEFSDWIVGLVLVVALALALIFIYREQTVEEFSEGDVVEFSAAEVDAAARDFYRNRECDGPYSYGAWSGMADDGAEYMQFNNETREWEYSRKGG